MANGGESSGQEEQQYVLRWGVRAGLKREFSFAMKAQSELAPYLGRTRSSSSVKKPKKSEPSDFVASPSEPMDLVSIPSTPSPIEMVAASSELEPPVTGDECSTINREDEVTGSSTVEVKPPMEITVITYKRLRRRNHADVAQSEPLPSGVVGQDEPTDKPLRLEVTSVLEGPVLVDKPVGRFTRSVLKETVEDGSNEVTRDDVADQVYTSGRRFTRSMLTKNLEFDSSLSGKNLEIKMSKKISVNQVPSNVRELLSTGLLEGLAVKYTVPNRKLPVLDGVIKGINILCYCASCNGTKAVSPLKFESHAGSVKKHPSDFIFLENGTNLHTIIRACKNVSINMLESTVQDLVGPTKQKSLICVKCKESFRCSTAEKFESLCDSCLEIEQNQSAPNVRILRERSESPSPDYSPSQKASSVKKARSFGQLTRKDLGLHKLVFKLKLEGTLVEYCNFKKKGDQKIRIKILGGYVKYPGIFCNCCHTVVSPSQFEAHAGWASRRKPYHHIYTSTGISLHGLSLIASKDRKICPKKRDDLCSICMDGGDLLLCNTCPRVYHLECVGLIEVPEGLYHCRYCKTGDRAVKLASSIDQIVGLCLRIASANDTHVGGCVLCKETDFSKAVFDDRTVLLCDQCEKEYHVGCLREHNMADLKKLPKGEWFCSDACKRIHKTLQSVVLGGPVQIDQSDTDLIKKKRDEKGLNGEDELDLKWRLLSNKWTGDDCKIFFSRAVNIFHESFAPMQDAVTKQDIIPSMVYGRTFGDLDYSGMYCVVLTQGSSVVSVGLLRVMGGEAAELPLVATRTENQGLGYFQALFSSIERLLARLEVKHFVLPAADEAFSIWTSKFGFSPITSDELEKCLKGSRTSVFEGTSFLHKLVPPLS